MGECDGGDCYFGDEGRHYNPNGLSVGGRIQDRACEYLELIFRPKGDPTKGRGVNAQCGWILKIGQFERCKYTEFEREENKIICPLSKYGLEKSNPTPATETKEVYVQEQVLPELPEKNRFGMIGEIISSLTGKREG